jgi:four helix bundle protein
MSEQSKQIMNRTKSFAHACVLLALDLPKDNLGWHLQKQLIRCSTSVAANYRSACLAQSKASFIAKISICLEECDESCFWFEFIRDENLLKEETKRLIREGEELRAIFYASRNTTRMHLK